MIRLLLLMALLWLAACTGKQSAPGAPIVIAAPETGPTPAGSPPTTADLPIFGSVWDTALVYAGDTYYYFVEAGTLGGTDLYLATYSSQIR